MGSVWNILERLLREANSYRGETDVRLADVERLVDKIHEKGGQVDIRGELNPQGGFFNCKYQFNPDIVSGWQSAIGTALVFASTTSKRDVPTVGVPQGGTVMKKNYGGRITYDPGQIRPHSNDRLGTTMTRYDMLMVAELGTVRKYNKKTGQNEIRSVGMLKRVAYSPADGSHEERRARLEDLLAGRAPTPSNRAQPRYPREADPTKQGEDEPGDAWRARMKAAVSDVPRGASGRMGLGAKVTAADDDQTGPKMATGMAKNADFARRMGQHGRDYQPQTPQSPDARARARSAPQDDDPDLLFPRKK